MLLTKFGAENQNWLANNRPPVSDYLSLHGYLAECGMGLHHVCGIYRNSQRKDLQEAAAIDGATRLQRMFRITLPCIMPMIVMMLVPEYRSELFYGIRQYPYAVYAPLLI